MTGILVLGFALGLKHALEADHVAAVATLAAGAGSLRRALRHGALWGLGHTLTLVVVGGTLLLLGRNVPHLTSQALEGVVGAMLVWLGLDLVRRVRIATVHGHDAPVEHLSHPHVHEALAPRSWRSLLVGMVHGLAGSAALVLVAASALTSPVLGLVYIVLFGTGSIAGMAVVSACLAVPLRAAGRRERLGRWLLTAAGATSAVLGTVILVEAAAALRSRVG